MEDQPIIIGTDEITTTPGLTAKNNVDREKSTAKSVTRRKKGFFTRLWPLMQAYGATLMAGFAIIPSIMLVLTVFLYLVIQNVPVWQPIAWGAIVTFIAWFVIAIPLAPLSSARAVNARSYRLLESRLSQLETRLYVLQTTTSEDQLKQYQRVALEEAYDNLSKLHDLVYSSTSRLPWVMGLGYVNTWNWLHRTEEALIVIEPIEMVVSDAYHDYMAISNSTMTNSHDLLTNLTDATKKLDPNFSSVFAASSLSSGESKVLGEIEQGVNQAAKIYKNNASTPDAEANARVTIREIRRTLNEFRDLLWEGLIRARNRLIEFIFIISLSTYLLFCIMILSGSSVNNVSQSERSTILAAAIFYAIGAISGLFFRIYQESAFITASDDYGLSLIRIFITLLLSGLAGVGGVFITSLLYTSIYGGQITYSLQNISPPQKLLYFLSAALFGLTSNLISRRIWKSAEKYMSALLSSKALGSKATQRKDEDKTALPLSSEQHLDQIDKYEVNKARQWFIIAIVAAIIGFFVILIGVAFLFATYTMLGVALMLIGVLPEIGAFFAFIQSINTTKQLSQRSLRQQVRTPRESSASALINNEDEIAKEPSSLTSWSDMP